MERISSRIGGFAAALLIACLSGLGIGSGGLLVIWLTMIEGISAETARGLNLLFFVFIPFLLFPTIFPESFCEEIPLGGSMELVLSEKSIRKQNLKIVWLFQDMNATILRKSFLYFQNFYKLRGEMTNGVRGCRCMTDWQGLSRQGSWYLFYFKCLQLRRRGPVKKVSQYELCFDDVFPQLIY